MRKAGVYIYKGDLRLFWTIGCPKKLGNREVDVSDLVFTQDHIWNSDLQKINKQIKRGGVSINDRTCKPTDTAGDLTGSLEEFIYKLRKSHKSLRGNKNGSLLPHLYTKQVSFLHHHPWSVSQSLPRANHPSVSCAAFQRCSLGGTFNSLLLLFPREGSSIRVTLPASCPAPRSLLRSWLEEASTVRFLDWRSSPTCQAPAELLPGGVDI